MRKRVAVLCVVCLSVFLFWGCQKQKPEQKAEDLPELVIGWDNYEPFTYVGENGKLTGIDAELAEEACERMGMKPVFVEVKWDDKDSYLKNGEIHCIWSCYTMTGREGQYLWTEPYTYSRQVVVVKSGSEIQTLDDLTGKRAAVQSSTKPEGILLKREEERIPAVSDVYCMENMELIFAALQNDYVDAVAGHETAVKQYMDMMPGQYRILEESLQDVEVSVAFDKDGDAKLAARLNAVLRDMEKDGGISRILEKYGVDPGRPNGGGAS